MNTRKQILVMAALILVGLIALGAYAAWYPSRASSSETDYVDMTAERGSINFAQNCRLCHGDVGEGGIAGARLPQAPQLNRPDLQGFTQVTAKDPSGVTLPVKLTADVTATDRQVKVDNSSPFKSGQTIMIDAERMDVTAVNGLVLDVTRGVGHTKADPHTSGTGLNVLDPDALKNMVALVTNTITCGLVGTFMPAWSDTQNGPLNAEQIRQLMTLITNGRWDLVAAEDNVIDLLNTKLTADITADATSMNVSDVSVFSANQHIRMGDERLQVTAVPKLDANAKDKSGTIKVDRGVLGSTPLDHAAGEPIYNFPEAPQPQLNNASCGQTAKPTAPAGSPTLVENFVGQTVNVVAKGIKFDTNQIQVKTGGQIRIHFDNQDQGVQHNFAVYQSSTTTTQVAPGSVGVTFEGVNQDDVVFTAPQPGAYYFRCDVHPTIMNGNFIVTP